MQRPSADPRIRAVVASLIGIARIARGIASKSVDRRRGASLAAYRDGLDATQARSHCLAGIVHRTVCLCIRSSTRNMATLRRMCWKIFTFSRCLRVDVHARCATASAYVCGLPHVKCKVMRCNWRCAVCPMRMRVILAVKNESRALHAYGAGSSMMRDAPMSP